MNQPVETYIPLKRCPFCGANSNMFKLVSDTYVVQCENSLCKAEQIAYNDAYEAARHWNNRWVEGK